MTIIWGGHSVDRPQSSRRPWFLLSLLTVAVCILLMTVFDGIFSPLVRRRSQIAQCMHQQREVVLSMLVYANDHEQNWPVFLPESLLGRVRDPHEARIVTSRSVEMLAILGFDISNRSLRCPSHPGKFPTMPPSTTRDDGQWGTSVGSILVYAYDWAAPLMASGARVMFADRELLSHGNQVAAVRADGSGATLYRGPSSTGWRTEGWDGAPVPKAAMNKDVGGDDIYSPLDDGPGFLAIGQASATRCWVK